MIYFDHMKEIKFRARYEPTGEWHYFRLIDLLQGVKDHVRYSHWPEYIGKTVKNGKEIYKGDIVKYFDDLDHEEIGIIQYAEDYMSYIFLNPTEEWHMLPYDCHSGRPLEIIGNIYENPELINHLEDTIQAA
jgi:uncharacterized phage protein (TIGR01671 family)